MRALAIIGVLFAMFPSSAVAGAYYVNADGSNAHAYNRWSVQSQAPAPDGVITVLPKPDDAMDASCGSDLADGCYDFAGHITLRIQNQRLMRLTFWHETGHVFDATMMTPRTRSAFMRIFGLRGEWETADYETTPNEVFAAAYSACALLGPEIPSLPSYTRFYVNSDIEYVATAREHRKSCELIRRVALGR